MKRRIALALMVVALSAIAFPSAAAGWSYSTAVGLDDRYWGTHEWAVWQAYVAAGKPAWFDLSAAIPAADEPDIIGDKYNHVYQVANNYGDTPHRVADLYYQATRHYRAGDYKAASRAFGLLSHYYADAADPFHTAKTDARRAYTLYHADYENSVRQLTRRKTDKLFLTLRSRRSVTNVRAKTISSAYVANGHLDAICDAWPNGGIDNKTVQNSTRVALSEAVNGLADIIVAIPTGTGRGLTPAAFSTFKPDRRYVAKNKNACAVAKIVNKNGDPIRGVRVTFTWEFAAGTKKHVRYTDKYGYAKSYQNTGSQPWYKPFYVSAKSVTFGNTLASTNTWFMTTPTLEPGETGFSSWMSNKRPVQDTVVTASAKAVSTSGKPVPNLRVKFVWKRYSGNLVTYATTDSYGVARSKRNIGGAKVDYKVYVVATTQAGGINRQWTANYTPQAP